MKESCLDVDIANGIPEMLAMIAKFGLNSSGEMRWPGSPSILGVRPMWPPASQPSS